MRIFIFILFTQIAWSQSLPYRLVVPKSISSSKKSFIINLGRSDDLTEGSIATFTHKGISFLAKVTSLNKFHSMWTITSKDLLYPFSEGKTLTMYNNSNYLWEVNERSEQQRIELERKRGLRDIILKRVSLKVSYFLGLSQTVSQVDVDEEEQRNGLGIKAFYEHPLTNRLSLLGGLQFTRETIQQQDGQFRTQRFFGLAGIEFNTAPISDLYFAKFFTGLVLGYGLSNTTLPNDSFSGTTFILPEFYVGLNFPVNPKWSFLVQTSLTSVSTSENVSDDQEQTTNQINLEFVGGIKYLF